MLSDTPLATRCKYRVSNCAKNDLGNIHLKSNQSVSELCSKNMVFIASTLHFIENRIMQCLAFAPGMTEHRSYVTLLPADAKWWRLITVQKTQFITYYRETYRVFIMQGIVNEWTVEQLHTQLWSILRVQRLKFSPSVSISGFSQDLAVFWLMVLLFMYEPKKLIREFWAYALIWMLSLKYTLTHTHTHTKHYYSYSIMHN